MWHAIVHATWPRHVRIVQPSATHSQTIMRMLEPAKTLIRKALGTHAIRQQLQSIHGDLQTRLDRLQASAAASAAADTSTATAATVRESVANEYLSGNGIEIGAFASPLKTPSQASVSYVDRYNTDELEKEFNLAGLTPSDFGFDPSALVVPDIVDDGESLAKLGDLTQDFVIANHVLEHFENPVKGFANMLRVLRHGGFLYLALPEMEHSFDRIRQPTPFAHVWRDYIEGPAWSRRQAFDEFAQVFVENGMAKNLFAQKSGQELREFTQYVASELDRVNFSIHFHAWRKVDMIELFLQLKSRLKIGFSIELIKASGDEVIFVFKKIPYKVCNPPAA